MFNGKSFNKKFLFMRKYYDFTSAIIAHVNLLACVPAQSHAIVHVSGKSMQQQLNVVRKVTNTV